MASRAQELADTAFITAPAGFRRAHPALGDMNRNVSLGALLEFGNFGFGAASDLGLRTHDSGCPARRGSSLSPAPLPLSPFPTLAAPAAARQRVPFEGHLHDEQLRLAKTERGARPNSSGDQPFSPKPSRHSQRSSNPKVRRRASTAPAGRLSMSLH
ncbi:hypothetical protein PCL_09708 [Purpureocillium lilacinum]|uniref:Uncharacterized protein n=1 Tax=Purpureocillium lilacinum TaxID=33203 RepID=A0A2U3EE13_PURLI|nr:hypothetical protein Purlil1_3610 [Purpureocillium lilacinum]PWI72693.1 hypothetical protein PCL_09708 [Purpureocillium lilacinum]